MSVSLSTIIMPRRSLQQDIMFLPCQSHSVSVCPHVFPDIVIIIIIILYICPMPTLAFPQGAWLLVNAAFIGSRLWSGD